MKIAENNKIRSNLCCYQNKRELTDEEKEIISQYQQVEEKIELEYKEYLAAKEELIKETKEEGVKDMIEVFKEGDIVNVFGSNDNTNWEFIARTQYSKDNKEIFKNKKYKYVHITTAKEVKKVSVK